MCTHTYTPIYTCISMICIEQIWKILTIVVVSGKGAKETRVQEQGQHITFIVYLFILPEFFLPCIYFQLTKVFINYRFLFLTHHIVRHKNICQQSARMLGNRPSYILCVVYKLIHPLWEAIWQYLILHVALRQLGFLSYWYAYVYWQRCLNKHMPWDQCINYINV